MKLQSPFGEVITLTQSPHGVQNKQAIDTAKGKLYAPADCEIPVSRYFYRKRYHPIAKVYTEQDTWFDVLIEGTSDFCEFVHGKPIRTGKFKKGELIAETVPQWDNKTGKKVDHWHSVANVNRKWDVILNYIERSNTIVLAPGFKNQHWKNWSTWEDKQLTSTSIPVSNMEQDFVKTVYRLLLRREVESVLVLGKQVDDLKRLGVVQWFNVMFSSAEAKAQPNVNELYGTVDTLKAKVKALEGELQTNAETTQGKAVAIIELEKTVKILQKEVKDLQEGNGQKEKGKVFRIEHNGKVVETSKNNNSVSFEEIKEHYYDLTRTTKKDGHDVIVLFEENLETEERDIRFLYSRTYEDSIATKNDKLGNIRLELSKAGIYHIIKEVILFIKKVIPKPMKDFLLKVYKFWTDLPKPIRIAGYLFLATVFTQFGTALLNIDPESWNLGKFEFLTTYVNSLMILLGNIVLYLADQAGQKKVREDAEK